jgi:NhaP-type Na+/H+ or K+/H+ antiporter
MGDQAWGLVAVEQIGLAIAAALAVGYVGGKLLGFAKERGWTSAVSEQIAILALALLSYVGAVAIGGNGFVAAFLGGLLFRAGTRARSETAGRFTETLGLSATFLVWSIFGALFVGELFSRDLSARPIVYALASLTVIRMVPVVIALIGTRLRPSTVAFMGWFGPRGLASVVFTLIALEELEHGQGGAMLVATATWTILLSVVLHGITASQLAARYGRSIGKVDKIPENAPAGEPRIRLHERRYGVTAAGRAHESEPGARPLIAPGNAADSG